MDKCTESQTRKYCQFCMLKKQLHEVEEISALWLTTNRFSLEAKQSVYTLIGAMSYLMNC